MKGHIRQRSPGRWAIVLDQRDPETGKRKRRWHSFKGTKREAQSDCARLVAEVKAGGYLEPGKATVSAFLDQWHVQKKGANNTTRTAHHTHPSPMNLHA